MKTFREFMLEGTKYLYHGTSASRLASMQRDGHIRPTIAGTTSHWSGPHPSEHGVYLAAHPVSAMSFAHSAAMADKSDPVVLKIHRNAVKGLKKDREYTTKSAYYHPTPVPASAIAGVHRLNNPSETEALLAHPFHHIATAHGFTPERKSSDKNREFVTYTRPGTMHQGKDYLHLGLNHYTHNPRWDFGSAGGSDEKSLEQHLKK